MEVSTRFDTVTSLALLRAASHSTSSPRTAVQASDKSKKPMLKSLMSTDATILRTELPDYRLKLEYRRFRSRFSDRLSLRRISRLKASPKSPKIPRIPTLIYADSLDSRIQRLKLSKSKLYKSSAQYRMCSRSIV